MTKKIIHHHLIYQAKVGNNFNCNSKREFRKFLYQFVKSIKMKCLIAARVKLSHQNAWTGMIGIVTSHITFHYWRDSGYVQLDIYSCKEFDRKKTINYLNNFWKTIDYKTLFIKRNTGEDFKVKKEDGASSIIRDFRKKGISKEDEEELLKFANNDLAKYRRFAQRRLFDEPIAYIKGYIEFYNRRFKVDDRTYPTPKITEKFVKVILDDLTKNSSLLEVGTGAGTLAITIKKEKQKIQVFASDINTHSLKVAKDNILKHNVRIELFESNYVDDLNIPEPTHIIADLPWGDENNVLEGNSLKELKFMSAQSFFHPLGKYESYKELIDSVLRKGWKSKLFIESGLIKKEEIVKIIPKNLKWEYKKFNNYSVTIINFDKN